MKLLVIRMSSLGDVILSTSFLESLPASTTVDWIISKEFAFVLKGHPRIRHLIEFDKKSGFWGWVQLIQKISHQDYDARVDLHVTIRSQLARYLFHWFDVSRGIWIPWKKISKQRINFYGYLFFKKLWPKFLRPTPLWKRFARLAVQITQSDHELKHPSMLFQVLNAQDSLNKYQLESQKFFVVMPSSRWKSKEWGSDSYFELSKKEFLKSGLIPVVLGRENDQSAVSLIAKLKEHQINHRSILNENDFAITGLIIQNSAFYVGSDTGLAHYAEAVGTRAIMIFGPTRPDLGFGPWKENSSSVTADVFCSPCSKDGRICYRLGEPYACLKRIIVDQVSDEI